MKKKKWHLFIPKRIGSLTYTPKPVQNWKQELAVASSRIQSCLTLVDVESIILA